MKRRHQGGLQEMSMATSLLPGCRTTAADARVVQKAARWRVVLTAYIVVRPVPGQFFLEAECDIASELSLAIGSKSATMARLGPGTMLQSGHFSSRLLGRDASHRTRKLDTHLTHGCMQHFRHFSRQRAGSAGSRREQIDGFQPFSEAALRQRTHTAR